MNMDTISFLQSRVAQLEAKLGLSAPNASSDSHQGDSITENLLNTASTIHNATEGHEKLREVTQRATELNNYTDPNFIEKIQENEMHMREVTAAEPIIKHHCHCMSRCKQAAPVLESEPLAEVPKMQETVDNMHMAAAEVKQESDYVSQGVAELAGTCGAAASNASEQLANIAQKVEQVEQKKGVLRRNGLD